MPQPSYPAFLFADQIRQTRECLEYDFINPLWNAAYVQPRNELFGALSRATGTQSYPLAHPLELLPVSSAETYSYRYWMQNAGAAIGSIAPYVVAGRIAGAFLCGLGESFELRGMCARVATSQKTAQIAGAASYDALREPAHNETRALNAASGACAFSLYELSSAMSRSLPLAGRLATRLAFGAAASVGSQAVAHPDRWRQGFLLSDQELAREAITGAVLNLGLPLAQDSLIELEDAANLSLNRGVPLQRYLSVRNRSFECARLQKTEVTAEQMRELLNDHPWARVQGDSKASTYQSKKDLITLAKGDRTMETLLHELQHRADAQAKLCEPGLQVAQARLHAGDLAGSWSIYRAVRLAEETRARLAERKFENRDGHPRRPEVDNLKQYLPETTANCGKTYEQCWREEFEQFKLSNGTFRPSIDFSDAQTADLERQRKRLIDLTESRQPEVKEIMADVEARSDLERKQIAHIYCDLARMVLDRSPSVKELNPKQLAVDVLGLVAEPREVTQGRHPTCGPAALEFITYTEHPLNAARLVSHVARHRSFVTTDHTHIELNTLSLSPERRLWQRSHANQIFQTTAVNVYWQRQKGFNLWLSCTENRSGSRSKGALRYERQPTNRLSESPYRLMDYAREPAAPLFEEGPEKDFDIANPYVTPSAIHDIYSEINGATRQHLTLPSEYRTPEELHRTLQQVKGADGFPSMLSIDCGNPPFGDGVHSGRHYIVITGFDCLSGRVSLFNPWGFNAQRNGLSLKELWAATQPIKKPKSDEQSYKEIKEYLGVHDH